MRASGMLAVSHPVVRTAETWSAMAISGRPSESACATHSSTVPVPSENVVCTW